VKWTCGEARATRTKASLVWPNSVCVERRNFRRTGVLKNKSRTSTVVPTGHPQGVTAETWPPLTVISAPLGASAGRLRRSRRLTSAIEARASPRKPNVPTRNRSSAEAILLVAWLATASGRSSAGMPPPLSTTRTSSTPPASTLTSIRVARASTAFSINSLTALAGRSITSPAAILLMTLGGSWRMGMGQESGMGGEGRGAGATAACVARPALAFRAF